MIGSAIQQLRIPLAEAKEGGWIPYPQFKGRTASLDFMGCHVSVLSPGCCPHPPHAHIEEELLIVLAGKAEIVIAQSPGDANARIEVLEPGQFSYYPAWQHHTIRNVSAEPVHYLMFKWAGRPSQSPIPLGTGVFDYRPSLGRDDPRAFAPHILFDRPTGWLKRLHCHLSLLKPGGGYATHADRHDVAIVLLEGEIEVLGQRLRDNGIAYFSAGIRHGMLNPGSRTAKYIVFEFDTGSDRKTRSSASDDSG